MLQAFTAYAVAATERANSARYLGKGTAISLLFHLGEGAASKAVERALNAKTPIQSMGVDHCCAYVLAYDARGPCRSRKTFGCQRVQITSGWTFLGTHPDVKLPWSHEGRLVGLADDSSNLGVGQVM